MSNIVHYEEFPTPITRAEFEAFVAERKYYGYHPAGYGGDSRAGSPFVDKEGRATKWVWVHWDSCD